MSYIDTLRKLTFTMGNSVSLIFCSDNWWLLVVIATHDNSYWNELHTKMLCSLHTCHTERASIGNYGIFCLLGVFSWMGFLQNRGSLKPVCCKYQLLRNCYHPWELYEDEFSWKKSLIHRLKIMKIASGSIIA